jgi:hypothetical protein
MDPSQIQSDKANDVHSLENTDGAADQGDSTTAAAPQETTSADGKTKVTDASHVTNTPAPAPPAKPPLLRRLWQKLNIYLLLFILVVVVAVGVLVFLTVRSRKTSQVSLNPQGLSDSALQQLANTDVTVGDAKQILTVQSNAVFAGSVLVRSNLEVAGTLKVGGALSLTELSVSGTSKFKDAQVENLTVGESMNLQGSLAVKGGLSVNGNSTFTGSVVAGSVATSSLTLNGNLNLTHHITAGGTIPAIAKGTAVGSGGTVSLSGSDTGGSVTINTGTAPPAGCFATITFSETFSNTPHVVITPVGSAAADLTFYITRSTTNFTICSTNNAPPGQTFGFDYIVFA